MLRSGCGPLWGYLLKPRDKIQTGLSMGFEARSEDSFLFMLNKMPHFDRNSLKCWKRTVRNNHHLSLASVFHQDDHRISSLIAILDVFYAWTWTFFCVHKSFAADGIDSQLSKSLGPWSTFSRPSWSDLCRPIIEINMPPRMCGLVNLLFGKPPIKCSNAWTSDLQWASPKLMSKVSAK